MEKVLISGGTGLIGSYLAAKLKEKRYEVALLTRNRVHEPIFTEYHWDPEKNEIDSDAVSDADYIIHLAGANIGEKRWTKERRELIIESRVKSADLLFRAVSGSIKKPKAFISASATGYYGAATTDKIFVENDPPATDFLGETCRLWEQSADRFEELGVRTVKIRTGVVLSGQEGALAKMALPVRIGFGSALGNGRQYVPWIHIADLCNIYIMAIENVKVRGAYNAVAPEHKTNKEFMSILAHVMNKPFWFPNVPAILLKILFGEMAAVILDGSRVSSERIISSGYRFRYPELEVALNDLFRVK